MKSDKDTVSIKGRLGTALEIRDRLGSISLFVKQPTDDHFQSALEAREELGDLLNQFEELSQNGNGAAVPSTQK